MDGNALSPAVTASITLGSILGLLLIALIAGSLCWRVRSPRGSQRHRAADSLHGRSSDSNTRERSADNQERTIPSAKDPLVSVNSLSNSLAKSLTGSFPQHAKGWPQDSNRPAQNGSSLALDIATDVVLLLLSACFFTFAILAVVYHKKPVDRHPTAVDRLLDAAKIGPSVFPILFAAVLGRLFKALMNWRLEHGAKLGFLDLLAGSTSAANTILTQIHIGLPSLLGLILLVAWAFSPLGGQATLRVLRLQSSDTLTTNDIMYMTNNITYMTYVSGSLGLLGTLINGLFNAALLGPRRVKESPVDTWNNVKIPMIEYIAQDQQLIINSTWLPVPQDDNVVYSSLIGIPISTMPSDSRSTFFMETSYLILDCSKIKMVDQEDGTFFGSQAVVGTSSANGTTADRRFMSVVTEEVHYSGIFTNSTASKNISCHRDDPHNDMDPRLAAYYFWSGSPEEGIELYNTLCSFQTTYVEVEVTCDGPGCRSTRIRNSTLANPARTWTLFDGDRTNCLWWAWFMQLFMNSVTVGRSGAPTPVQGYFLDPNSPASPLRNKGQNPMQLDARTFATRFAQLLNSFMLICAGPYAVSYGFDGDMPGADIEQATKINTAAQSVRSFKIIVCDPAWLTVLLIASVFLLAAGAMSIALRAKRRTPELALNWSTVIRDNPHIPGADTACLLDDLQRSKLLRHTSLMFGDVASDRDVGHLAIGTKDGGGTMMRVRDDRLYY
ncbi:unnamed protein product [Zymoseptoria tritici ST99CH_3D1]|uniref:Uncharacterized protein n=1 Tax=Zymoseptoria tritici (strain ST99CH_3D7) TaxID=1276538 RepID=A0A1X7S821_ZYMT9|nr:unnamed protein product [Zymoseptoria tritici ST99CH_3D7]SMR64108.1 unnamed protein product [Zymoseptoria tritici ST99CH_3D1]